MYKPVNAEDIFGAVDGNREKTVMQSKTIAAPLVNSTTEPQKPQSQMSDAEAIRAMGDRLSKIWED